MNKLKRAYYECFHRETIWDFSGYAQRLTKAELATIVFVVAIILYFVGRMVA